MKSNYEPPDWAGEPAPPLRGSNDVALELVVKGDVKRRVPLDVKAYDSFLIGRAKNCDIVLDGLEPQASRFHCVLQCKAGSSDIFVYDLGSAHGTMLNGRRVDAHSYTPMRVGEQLRFSADKPASCIAVLCGPEEAMADESEVDLSAFREHAAKQHEQQQKAQQAELQKRKDAKRQRLAKEAQQKAVVQALAAKAQEQMQQNKEAEAKDKKKLHEVTWGMGADAVEPASEDMSEEVQNLMDDSGRLDFEKLRQKKLTDKQVQLVRKAEDKKKRVTNLLREQARIEEKITSQAKRRDEADLDIDELRPEKGGFASAEQLQGLENKLEKAEEDLAEQTNNIFLSLGLRKPGDGSFRLSKRKVALYDTRLDEDDDDFFDRTATKKSTGTGHRGDVDGDEATELTGLPSFDGVETLATLELKAGQLKAERGRLGAQWAAELVRDRHRTASEAKPDAEEDSLDSFMTSNRVEIREDRHTKLQRRIAAVDERLQEGATMLRVARRNADEPLSAPKFTSRDAAVSGSAKQGALKAAAESAAAIAAASAVVSAAAFAANSSVGATAPAIGGSPPAVKGQDGAKAHQRSAEPMPEHPTEGSEPQRKVQRGPEKPPAAVLAQASAAAAPALALEQGGDGAEAHSTTAAPAAASPAAVPTPVSALLRPQQSFPSPAKGLIDPSKAGLQVLQAPGQRRSNEQSADASSMPPPAAPAKKRKVYGVALPPPGAAAAAAAAARDAGLEASGEAEQSDR